jgi:ubiquinone/menaquinone biosynthesis C-methylase UbiE
MTATAFDPAIEKYHLNELRIAQDASAPGHLLPHIPATCKSVLDIGCGAGQTLIASALPAGVAAWGVDPDARALALGRGLTDRVHFASARGEQLPFADGTFDMVFSRVALPYMNIPAALAEIARVMRPDGHLWLSLHPPAFALRTMSQAIRAGSLRGAVFPVYTLVNALSLRVANRQLLWPFGRRRYESVQTASGMKHALERARFTDVRIHRDKFFVATARLR